MGDNSDEDCDDLVQATALPVSNITDFDPSVPPKSGEEYLRRVQLEAQQYPDFTIAEPVKNKSSKRNTGRSKNFISYGSLKSERFVKASQEICETQVWADDTISRFKCIRDRVEKARKSINNMPCAADTEKIPHFRNLTLWRKIILGNIEEHETDSELKLVFKSNGGKSPRLSTILPLPQVAIIDFLETLTKWIKEYGWSHQLAVWIYSLLACLEVPLHSETVSVIRELSRACSTIRTKHDLIEDKSLVTSLSLIICLISRFFGQLDISDDYLKELPIPDK